MLLVVAVEKIPSVIVSVRIRSDLFHDPRMAMDLILNLS